MPNPPSVPSADERANAAPGVLSWFSSRLLRLLGWTLVLARPVPMKCVVVFYPHTSNWDFVIGLLAKWATGIFFRWIGKDSLFKGPFGPLFAHWGGIPVNRREHTGFIGQMRAAFDGSADFRVAIAPEGTRRFTSHWKSGFYHMARAVDVPVGLAFIDYPRHQIGIGAWTGLTGDMASDMARIAAFYADKRGRQPANQGPVRVHDDA